MMDYYSSPLLALLYIMFSRQNEDTRKLPKIGDLTRDICILFLYPTQDVVSKSFERHLNVGDVRWTLKQRRVLTGYKLKSGDRQDNPMKYPAQEKKDQKSSFNTTKILKI